MAKNYTYQEFIEQTVTDWTHELVEQRIAAVKKAKLIASGELQNIRGHIVKGAIRDGAKMELFFREYGRIQDMKRTSFTEDTPVSKIIEWIESKGLQKFKNRFSKLYGKIPSSNARFIHQLAWSIKSGKRKKRRRKWYSKGTWGAIYGLYDDLLIGLSDPALQKAKEALTHGS